MVRYDKGEFRKKYPNLAKEMSGRGTIRIQAVRSDVDEAEKAAYGIEGY
ncbi:MAG TPA: DUF2095 domain-containing protein, partial [Hadesarchaea archaeon]|nr:DUF2095 domain-containing protein [Hadesarchaea archaeon]